MSSRKKRFTTVIFLFFFFQAEDGIRDADVTGVQTCALPIFRLPHAAHGLPDEPQVRLHPASRRSLCDQSSRGRQRSEERRVGKECKYGGGRDEWNKKEYRMWFVVGLAQRHQSDTWARLGDDE